MDFPSTMAIVKQYNFFLLSGPGALFAGILLLGRMVLQRVKRSDPQARERRARPPQLLFLAVALIFIGAIHLNVYRSVAVARDFQTIRLDDVDGLIIEAISDSDGHPRQAVLVDDAAYARTGLRKLTTSASYSRNHETFSMGYRIQLIIKGIKADKFLSVYRRSSRAGEVAVVIPHHGIDPSSMEFQGGTYEDEAFVIWVEEALASRI